jgi:hypothetical protein
MTPATIIRRPRGPITFAALSALFLDRDEETKVRRPKARAARCVALQDDGSPCNLPARYLDFNRGGHVCYEHKPDRKKEVLCLV